MATMDQVGVIMDLISHVHDFKDTMAVHAQAAIDRLEQGGLQMEILHNIFDEVSDLIDENEEVLQCILGEAALEHATKELQKESSFEEATVLNTYIRDSGLRRLVQRTISMGSTDGPRPEEIAPRLDEMQVLIEMSEGRLSCLTSDSTKGQSTRFRTGRFGQALQELTELYIALEGFFMKEMARRVILSNKLLLPEAIESSMVVDVFCILHTCARRAISTSSVQAVSATTNQICDILNKEYKQALMRMSWNPDLEPFIRGDSLSWAGIRLAAALNDVDITTEYIGRLLQEIEEGSFEIFCISSDVEEHQVKTRLVELGETSKNFQQLATAGLRQFADAIVPQLQSNLDYLAAMPSKQIKVTEIKSDPWVQKLYSLVEEKVAWLHHVLREDNFNSLVQLIIDSLVKLQARRFQLEKDRQRSLKTCSGWLYFLGDDSPSTGSSQEQR